MAKRMFVVQKAPRRAEIRQPQAGKAFRPLAPRGKPAAPAASLRRPDAGTASGRDDPLIRTPAAINRASSSQLVPAGLLHPRHGAALFRARTRRLLSSSRASRQSTPASRATPPRHRSIGAKTSPPGPSSTACTWMTTACVENWTIDWGDGSDPQNVSPQPWVIHQYPDAGQYYDPGLGQQPGRDYSATPTIGTTNLVGIGGTATGGLKATMSDISPTLHVAGAQTVAQGQTFALDNLAAFSYPNQSNASLFSYSIDWGDGSPPETNPTVTTIAYGGSGGALCGRAFGPAHLR